MIVVEKTFKLIVSDLPEMSYKDSALKYSPTFGFGDDKELMYFLTQKRTKNHYPLVWMVYPNEEEHFGTKASFSNTSFILAVETKDSIQNDKRFETVYKEILEPLYDNFVYLLKGCNTMNLNEKIKVVKYPNYSNELKPGNRETLKNSEQNKTSFIWDAIKVTISGVIDGKKCYRSQNLNKQ